MNNKLQQTLNTQQLHQSMHFTSLTQSLHSLTTLTIFTTISSKEYGVLTQCYPITYSLNGMY